ncbi:transcriptional regulator family: Fungal Specific TF [Penicillium roqueforti]|nr:transcriptional regulator family: Fungal Specific TF [Penicillium roqueforti]
MGPSGNRTNSLAFAKNDCHTCAALKEGCDRQRPRCGTCISNRRACGGFAMDLVWKELPVVNHGPLPRGRESGCSSKRDPQHTFKFTQGRPKRRRKPRQSNTVYQSILDLGLDDSLRHDGANFLNTTGKASLSFPSTPQPSSPEELGISKDCSSQSNEYMIYQLQNETHLSPGWEMGLGTMEYVDGNPIDASCPDTIEQAQLPTQLTLDPDQETSPGIIGNLNQAGGDLAEELFPMTNLESLSNWATEQDTDNPVLEEDMQPIYPIKYRNLAHKYEPILAIYDEKFCVMPLTRDCRINPFRAQTGSLENYDFLLHAIVALSFHHLSKMNNTDDLILEMHHHRSTALHLFSHALSQPTSLPLLDTLLILVSIEVCQSAFGAWGVHLNGAQKLITERKDMERGFCDSRMRAQLAMLIWWDTTIALMSRTEPRLPFSLLERLRGFDDSDGWSCFGLNGCPFELISIMARLAKLACIYQRTIQMEWTIFNFRPVRTIIAEVKGYVNKEKVEWDELNDLSEDFNLRRNRYYCIEAWRHAILLYIYHVFTKKPDDRELRMIDYFSRVILDCVRCMPCSDTTQKQVLLPVFLAAAEVGDENTRSMVREYCNHWRDVSRIYHFETASSLLDSIWKDWDPSTRSSYWWGLKVGPQDWMTGDVKGQSLVFELLLG